ncbi:MAG: DNA repair protein RecN [Neomegalonema sp.]|nr:DNA repair protein RecN [Neomegalonema sp.]
MLTRLSIRNIVLIEALDLEFQPGLNVLTGETGAGKSILLDSLGLSLGARAASGLVRAGAPGGSVSAEFTLGAGHPALETVRSLGFAEQGGALILRRTVSQEGRGRAFVNDEPASVSALRQIAEPLVEVHGQHDDRGLLDPSGHRAVLDAYAGLTRRVRDAEKLRDVWQASEAALAARRAAIEQAARDVDFLTHALAELEKLAPEPGEEARLDSERRRLRAAVRIAEDITAAAQALSAPQFGAEAQTQAAERLLGAVADQAEGGLDAALGALSEALDRVADAAQQVERAAQSFTIDPARLDLVEERLFALRALARKHQVPVDDLSALTEQIAQKLAVIEAGEAGLAQAQTAVAADRAAFFELAEALHERRQEAAARLDADVTAELAPLRMESARFVTEVTRLAQGQSNAAGVSQVAFRVATNPGAAPGPIDRIASGGELSRFLLALKVALSRASARNSGSAAASVSVIFDEIDRGVGGATADAVGARLLRLAAGESGARQVLVVTHSPQVAAKGEAHWRIEKQAVEGVMRTGVSLLGRQERIDEIARMLAGEAITDAARAAASALLEATPQG